MRKGIAVNLKGLIKVNCAPSILGNHCFLCAGPGSRHQTICSDCSNDMVTNTTSCPVCAQPNTASRICPGCQSRYAAPREKRPIIENTLTLFQYQYPVNRLIQNMKFNDGLDIACYLGEMLCDLFLHKSAAIPYGIIAVPLHPSRLISRGYNQSIELARPLARRLDIKLDTGICTRVRATVPQTDLPANKRRNNVLNAFNIAAEIPYKHVLLIDDVITTGSTVNELARMLHCAGVARIDVLACARAG